MTARVLKVAPVKSRSRKRWLLRISLGMVVVPAIVALAGCFFSQQVLTVKNGPVKADIIIVLGGESVERPEGALELFQQHDAPRILVSGFGDCQLNKQMLIKGGVPETAITLESVSHTTLENAQLSVPMLQQMGAHRAIIVTSWYHSRRALACFRKCGPGIQFYSEPVRRTEPSLWPGKLERSYVFQEYVKLAGYWVLYGVNPY